MDELRRLRELGDEMPSPDPHRKAEARAELLDLAAAEEQTPVEQTSMRATGVAGRLLALRRSLLRPAPAAGLAGLVVVAVAGTAIVLTGPGTGPADEMVDPAPRPEVSADPDVEAGEVPDEGIELAASCTDPDGRITVAYPDDWHTPEDDEPGACRFFGEDEVDVDAAIGGSALAELEIVVEPTPFDDIAAPGVSFDELDRQELEVDDRRGLRQRLEVTGEAALPEGVLVERILIELDGETLRLTMHDEDGDELDRLRPMLEDIARSVELHDG